MLGAWKLIAQHMLMSPSVGTVPRKVLERGGTVGCGAFGQRGQSQGTKNKYISDEHFHMIPLKTDRSAANDIDDTLLSMFA